jgi:hypothetical protein
MANRKAEKPRVLVILATLGERSDLLRLTLKSLKEQPDDLYDLYMIFPSKSKETTKIAKDLGATILEDPGSITKALNLGIDEAKPWHKYFTMLNDDDLLRPGSLAASAAALDADPQAVVAYGYCDYINEYGHLLWTSKAGRFAPWIMTWGPNLVPMPGLLMSIPAAKAVGKFDTSNKYSFDLELLLRLRKKGGRFINTKQTLAAFRWHSSSTTVANRKLVIIETQQVQRRALPTVLRPLTPLWGWPVGIATQVAAKRVAAVASKKAEEHK